MFVTEVLNFHLIWHLKNACKSNAEFQVPVVGRPISANAPRIPVTFSLQSPSPWLKLPSLLNQEYLDDIKKDIVPLCSYDWKMSPNTFNDGLWEWKAIFLKSSDIYMKQPHPFMKCHLFHIQYLLKKEEC